MGIYPVLSATDQAKAVKELTQHVRETTSDGETTRTRNGRKPIQRTQRLEHCIGWKIVRPSS